MLGFGLAALLVAALGIGACAGRQHPVTPADGAAAPRTVMLHFDNQATVYVDVYLIADELQWRLGRVPPGMRTSLSVPQSAIDRAPGFVQLAVIPGAQITGEARRDPQAILAVGQRLSEVLSRRWTFRQDAGAALQLQATPLAGRP